MLVIESMPDMIFKINTSPELAVANRLIKIVRLLECEAQGGDSIQVSTQPDISARLILGCAGRLEKQVQPVNLQSRI